MYILLYHTHENSLLRVAREREFLPKINGKEAEEKGKLGRRRFSTYFLFLWRVKWKFIFCIYVNRKAAF